MPTYCAAFDCGNTSTKSHGISFFRFPKEATRCKKWVINTRRADLEKKTPDQLHNNFYLCNSHFEDNQFTNNLHKKLNWNAVPTLFHVPNPLSKLDCKRYLPLIRRKETASAHPAMQVVTSKDVPSLDLSVQTDCKNTGGMTTETGGNIEEVTSASLPTVDQQSSVPSEIGPHNTPVNKRKAEGETNKRKTECEMTTAATTEAVTTVVQAPAHPLPTVNNQLLAPATINAPQTPVIRIIKLMPKIYRLPLQLDELNCGESIYKTAVLSARPTQLIGPLQTILSAPATSKATANTTAQSAQPTDSSSVRMICESFKQTDHLSQSAAISSTQTESGFVSGPTAAVPDVTQRVSHVRKQPDTPAEKQLKQRLQRMQTQLWRRNRKIEALKKKVSEIVPESTRPHRSVEAILDAARQFLTPFQLSLFRAQLMNSQSKEKHGYRWSTSDKIFGLQLLYKSPAAFRFVSEHLALPTQGTLRRFVAETLGSEDSEVTTQTSIPLEDIEEGDNTQSENVLSRLA